MAPDDAEKAHQDALARIRANREERRRLLVGHEGVVAAIEALLFRHDPIGLNFGHNTDEYRAEAETISTRRREAASASDVRRIAQEEFAAWFDPDMAGPEDRYEDIAAEIWALWSDGDGAGPDTPG